MAKKTAPVEKTQGGARTAFTDEQIAEFKAKLLELIPQGKTLRQILAEPGMCSMTYLFRELLPNDKEFSEQYARAFELRNEYWAEELVEIADDGSNDWMDTKWGPKFNKEAASGRGGDLPTVASMRSFSRPTLQRPVDFERL